MRQEKIPRGRPRSETARKAILKATRQALSQHGPSSLTVEDVARRAGVGKPTIYRYWPNAQALAMAAMMDADTPAREVEQGGSTHAQLTAHVIEIVRRLNTKRGRHMALLLAGAEPDGELFKAFSNKVMLEGRAAGIALIEAGQGRGEINPALDAGLVMDLILGAIFVRLLLRHASLDEALAQDACALVLGPASDAPKRKNAARP